MKIKESELRALVRKTFTKLVKEDIGGVEGLKQKDIAKTAANFLATKYGDSLGFMEQDEIKRKVLEAVIDQMKNSNMKGKDIAMNIFKLAVQELRVQGILKGMTGGPKKAPVVQSVTQQPAIKKPSNLKGKGSNLQQMALQRLFRGK